jgi:hypothetical protein
MWMHDTPVGLSLLTKKDFLDTLLSEVENEEHKFFKDLLRHVFVSDPQQRIKTETFLKKLKKERNVMNTVNNQSKVSRKDNSGTTSDQSKRSD